jgi:hypothetical protein
MLREGFIAFKVSIDRVKRSIVFWRKKSGEQKNEKKTSKSKVKQVWSFSHEFNERYTALVGKTSFE